MILVYGNKYSRNEEELNEEISSEKDMWTTTFDYLDSIKELYRHDDGKLPEEWNESAFCYVKHQKMLLLLGKNDVIVEYARQTLKIDTLELFSCPGITTHHSEFGKYVDIIKEKKPEVITTQNIEMIDVLLASDLDFEVITVKRIDGEIRKRKVSKEYVVENRKVWAFDPRD